MHDSEYQATYTRNEGQGKLVITDSISKGSKCFANSWKYSVKESFIWAASWQNQQNYIKYNFVGFVMRQLKIYVCPAKTQISLGIRPIWSAPSLCTQWVAKDPRYLPADSGCPGWSESSLVAQVLSWDGTIMLPCEVWERMLWLLQHLVPDSLSTTDVAGPRAATYSRCDYPVTRGNL